MKRAGTWTIRAAAWLLLWVPAMGAEDLAPLLLGGDLSALAVVEGQGAAFRDGNGQPVDLVPGLAGRGWNTYRLRLFVDPRPGGGIRAGDLEGTLALARRIRSAECRLLLDLHYSDTWADPSKQTVPAAWTGLPYPALLQRVETYSAGIMARFREEGLTPDYVQAGNEIGNGMLWPHGQIHGADPDGARERLAELLTAAVKGLRAPFSEKERVPVVIHHQQAAGGSATEKFFRDLEARGVPYDIIGLSYYPWWHGSFSAFQETLGRCAETFGKPVWVVETAYPHRETGWFGDKPHLDWPLTPEGQRRFLADVTQAVRATPRALGVLWWHPESIPAGRLRPWMEGACALFDAEGRPLPALQVWRP